MLRSKKISDYFEARLEDLRPGVRLPVDLHLYFSSNRHILIWRKHGEAPTEKFIKKYRSRGMKLIWIHRDDRALWLNYLEERTATPEAEITPEHEPAIAEATPAEATPTEAPPAEALPQFEPRTEEGKEINELLHSEAIPERQRTALVARAARELLAETVLPQDPAVQSVAMGHARDAVRDILEIVMEDATQDLRKTFREIWNLSTIEPGLDHAVNVASFAVLFAMAFGRISQDLLTDIALAGLLHDIGITQIPTQVAQTPWNMQTGRTLQRYSRHVDEGLRLLDEFAPGLSTRARPLIQQHHEKFDGTGYPLQLQGFQVNDIAQLICMADAVASMATGHWDGRHDRCSKLSTSSSRWKRTALIQNISIPKSSGPSCAGSASRARFRETSRRPTSFARLRGISLSAGPKPQAQPALQTRAPPRSAPRPRHRRHRPSARLCRR